MSITQSSDQSFQEDVLNSNQLVLVDFWAPWCGPCKMIAPVLDEIASEMNDKVKIVKVDVDQNPQIASQYGIRSIPALFLFKDGQVVSNKAGFQTKASIQKWLDENA